MRCFSKVPPYIKIAWPKNLLLFCKSCFILHTAWEPHRDKNYRERVVRNFNSQPCCECYGCQSSWDQMTNAVSLRHVLQQQGRYGGFLFALIGDSCSKPMHWKSRNFCFMDWNINYSKKVLFPLCDYTQHFYLQPS